MKHVRALTIAVLVAAFVLGAGAGVASGGEPETSQQLAEVRRATARYHDVARAEEDGYRQASGCVDHMGYHYLRSVASHADELDHTAPNILVYAPRADGGLRLVAVEYASWQPATLLDRTFDQPVSGGPPFHTLHAWVWQGNPSGVFTAHNPNVSCG
jgi:hypothetical protein